MRLSSHSLLYQGERSTLDLNDLKELTNTPLGGRGTYPNGPDVLAINVYKVSGSAIDANIIISGAKRKLNTLSEGHL